MLKLFEVVLERFQTLRLLFVLLGPSRLGLVLGQLALQVLDFFLGCRQFCLCCLQALYNFVLECGRHGSETFESLHAFF